MNELPLSNRSPTCPSHPVVFRATNPVVRHPSDSAEMVRHYVLGAVDLALIRTKRRSINRLGFAVQLCLLRYPGLGMGPAERPPEGMIAFVADQLAVPSAVFADYAQRDQTRREHAVELQRYLSLRSFGFAAWRACLRVGPDAAWATDRGEPSSRRCSPICGRTAFCFHQRRSWSESGWRRESAHERRPLRRSRPDCAISERDTLTGLLGSIPSVAPASPGCGIIRVACALQHHRVVGSSRICTRAENQPGAGGTNPYPCRAPRPADRRGRS